MLSNATNESGYVVQIDITDELGEAVSPTSATWTLTDGSDTVINSREDVAISSLASTVYITLGKEDLDRDDGSARKVEVTATYTSTLTGETQDIKACARFMVAPC